MYDDYEQQTEDEKEARRKEEIDAWQAAEFMRSLVIASDGAFLNHAADRKKFAERAYQLVDALAEARAERARR